MEKIDEVKAMLIAMEKRQVVLYKLLCNLKGESPSRTMQLWAAELSKEANKP